MDYKEVKNCRICNSTSLVKYLDLGRVPPCNSLIYKDEFRNSLYPISMLVCQECYLSQLGVVVNPEILYKNYVYKSSVSSTFKNHCFDMANKIKTDFPNIKYPVVLDIASNDGCLLNEFKRAGYRCLLGVDPSCDMTSYREKDIPVVDDFWSEALAREILGNEPYAMHKANFIIAQNVLGHVDDVHDFVRGIAYYLDQDGVFIGEVPYLSNLIDYNQFDTIYHEHLSYYLIKPLIRLFQDNGIPIFKVEFYPIHGGSIRIYASKSRYPEDGSVDKLLNQDEDCGFHSMAPYNSFTDRVNNLRERFGTLLSTLEGSVVGYGASAKGISLLNYCGIKNDRIMAIVDETKEKQGELTPGSMIKIVGFEYFKEVTPDYIILFPWNFKNELMEKTKFHKGKYIVPIPEVEVI